MNKKYNLALIPLSKSHEVIMLSKKFAIFADRYVLGNKSFPHVTLHQFHFEENEINQVWAKVSNTWKEKPIILEFNQFSCVSFDNVIFWISLLPNQSDVLHRMHGIVANMMGLSVKETFNPHMTLINTKNKECEKESALIFASYQPISDSFVLSLGKSDDVGQLTDILYRF